MSSSDRSTTATSPSVPTLLPVLAGLTASGLPLIETLTSCACSQQEDLNSREEKEGSLVLFGGLTAGGLPLVQGLVYRPAHILPVTVRLPQTVREKEVEKESTVEEEDDDDFIECIAETISEEQELIKEEEERKRPTQTHTLLFDRDQVEPYVEEFVDQISVEVVRESVEEATQTKEPKNQTAVNSSSNPASDVRKIEEVHNGDSWLNHPTEEETHQTQFRNFIENDLLEQNHRKSRETDLAAGKNNSLRSIEKLEQLENDLRKAFLPETVNPQEPALHGEHEKPSANSVKSSDDVFLSTFLWKLARLKMTDQEKYDDVVERLRKLEAELKIDSAGLPPDPEFTELVAKILKSSYPNADLQIIVNSSRKTTTTKSFYETETPGMVGLNGDQLRELQVKLMGNISSPENAANQPDTTASDAAQHKEVLEEGYAAPDGSEVVSKKMTRVVTTSQSTASGLDEHPEAARGAELIRLKVNQQMYNGDIDPQKGKIRLVPISIVPAARPMLS